MTEGESGELYRRNGDEKPMENGPEEKEVFRNGKRPLSRHHHPFLGFLSKAIACGTTSEQLTSLICSTQYQLAMYKTKKTAAPMLPTTAAFTSTDASNLLLAAAEVASIAGSSRGNALRLVKYVVYEEDRWNGSEAFEKVLVRGWRGLPMTLVADAGFMALSSPTMRILELAGLKFICDIEDPDPQWQLASIKLLGTLSSKGEAKSREFLAKRLKAASFNHLNLYLVQEIVGQTKRVLKCTKLSRGEEEKEEDPLLAALNEYEKQQSHLYKKERGEGYQDGQQKGGRLWQTEFCGKEKKLQQHTNPNLYTNRENSTDSAQECRGGGTTRRQKSVGSASTLEGSKDKKEQRNERKTSNNNNKPLKEGEGDDSEMLQLKGGLEDRSALAEKHNRECHCEEHLEPRMYKKRRVLDEEHASINGKQQKQQMYNPDDRVQQSEWHLQKGVGIGEEDRNGSRGVVVGGVKESVAAADISNLMTDKKDDAPISQNTPRATAFCASYESTSPVEAGAAFAVHHEADRETFCRQGDAKPEESLCGEPPCHVPVGCQEGRKYEVAD